MANAAINDKTDPNARGHHLPTIAFITELF